MCCGAASHQGAAEASFTDRIGTNFSSYRKESFESCCQKLQWSSRPSDDLPGAPLCVLEPLNPPLKVSLQLTDNNHLLTGDLRAGGLKVRP